MAAISNSGLLPDNSTNVHFQSWATFFENVLVSTGGWTVSTETGDTPPATLTSPTAANTKKGFRVYKMADGLQSTAPVFMRIDYGSGGAANTPGFWFTIGTGSDGAGNITGILFNGGTSTSPNASSNSNVATGSFNSYGSATTSRAAVAMFVSTNASYHLVFTIARSKDSNGNDTADGLLLIWRDGSFSSGGIAQNRYLICTVGTQPSLEVGLNYILTTKSPSESFGGDVGIGIVSHLKGVAQQPGTNFLITNSSDIAAEAIITLTLYGNTKTYVQLNALTPYKALVGSQALDSGARCLMRYD